MATVHRSRPLRRVGIITSINPTSHPLRAGVTATSSISLTRRYEPTVMLIRRRPVIIVMRAKLGMQTITHRRTFTSERPISTRTTSRRLTLTPVKLGTHTRRANTTPRRTLTDGLQTSIRTW
jgi:hypothetical protein